MRNFRLFVLQLKTSFKRVSVGLLIMAVLFGVPAGIFAAATHAGRATAGDVRDTAGGDGLISVAVVSDDSFFTDYVLNLVNDIPGVIGICDLIRMDMDEAAGQLDSGDVSMIIEIPDDFYEEASAMRDARLIIYTMGEPAKTEYKLLAMLGSVTGLMEITDAQILSMYDGINAYDLPVERSDMEWALLADTYAGFNDRTEWIDVSSVSVYGSYDVVRFYLTAALMCMIIIGSVTLFGLYGRQNIRLESAICRGGKTFRFSVTLSKVCAMWITLGIWGELIAQILNLVLTTNKMASDGVIRIASGARFHIAMWLMALSVALWIHFLSSVIGSDTPHFRVTYILAVLIMLIGSGVVVPAVYLPDTVRILSGYLPAGAVHRMLISGMWDTGRLRGVWSMAGFVVTVITDAVILVISMFLYERELLKHD